VTEGENPVIAKLYSVFDKIVCSSVNDKTVKRDLAEANAYRDIPAIQEMNTEFIALDTKASALIAHLSLMVAAIAILHATVRASWLKLIFLLEIIFYVLTLMVVIRVIYYAYYAEIVRDRDNPTPEQRAVGLMKELKKRMVYYRLAHSLTNVGTAVLVLSLMITFLVGSSN
jgi:hypothetical protein